MEAQTQTYLGEAMTVFKHCEHCKKVMTRKPRQRQANWSRQRFCSDKCENGSLTQKKSLSEAEKAMNLFLYGRPT